jgi:hypothetical protein
LNGECLLHWEGNPEVPGVALGRVPAGQPGLAGLAKLTETQWGWLGETV